MLGFLASGFCEAHRCGLAKHRCLEICTGSVTGLCMEASMLPLPSIDAWRTGTSLRSRNFTIHFNLQTFFIIFKHQHQLFEHIQPVSLLNTPVHISWNKKIELTIKTLKHTINLARSNANLRANHDPKLEPWSPRARTKINVVMNVKTS